MLSQAILDSVPFSIRVIRRLSHDCMKGTLSFNHLRTLFLIEEGMGQTQIADTLMVSMAAVSKLITSLEQKKYLKRKTGKDRRSFILELTPAGKKVLGKLSTYLSEKIETAAEVLSQNEKNDLNKGLQALKKLMKVIHDQ